MPSTDIDDPEAAAAEAALYDQATRLSLPPMTPPPAPADAQLTAQLEAELEQTRAQLAEALAEAERYRRQVLEASEHQLVELALVIAERVVGRELHADPQLVNRWAREGMQALVGQGPMTLLVSPDVKASLDANPPRTSASLTIEVDETLPPASCRIRGALGAVDASLVARLDAVADALGVSERPAARGGAS